MEIDTKVKYKKGLMGDDQEMVEFSSSSEMVEDTVQQKCPILIWCF